MGNPVTKVNSVSFDQQLPIGGKGPETTTEVSYYPNPVTDHLCINGVPAGNCVDIISLEDKIMRSMESNGTDIILSVADLPKGTYLLRTASSTLKFIKY